MKKDVPMFQVYVTDTAAGHEIPIGPIMDQRDALLKLVETVNVAILKGALHDWKDAHVVRIQ